MALPKIHPAHGRYNPPSKQRLPRSGECFLCDGTLSLTEPFNNGHEAGCPFDRMRRSRSARGVPPERLKVRRRSRVKKPGVWKRFGLIRG
jgi:hypothetical protein